MKTINAIIRKMSTGQPLDPYTYRIILVKEDGSRQMLPALMSKQTAAAVQHLYRHPETLDHN